MTEFQEMEVDEDLSEIPEDELRSTFAAFLETHESNVEAVNNLRASYSEKVESLESEVESLEDKVSEFTQEKAEEAAQYVNIPEELVAERFSLEEIEQIIEEGEEFSESNEEEDEDSPLTTFAERGDKGKQDKEPSTEFRQRATKLMGKKIPLNTED